MRTVRAEALAARWQLLGVCLLKREFAREGWSASESSLGRERERLMQGPDVNPRHPANV